MSNKIYEQYLKEKDIYKIFGEKIKILVKDLMDINRINYQSITCRTKEEKSFLNKLERKKYKYKRNNRYQWNKNYNILFG